MDLRPVIEVRQRQLLLDGVPRIIMSGEVHYFRVPRDQWVARIDAAVRAGCSAIASYLPWLVHELPDGTLDVTGATRRERDIAAFIDLCAAAGLGFIARPGPFVMAELKNEGIPHRVYREHPEIRPLGWDGVPAPTSTVDYLAPAFLAETRRWYEAVLPLLVPRLQPAGGPVVAVQLDNEIGMLAWVSNSPDLTDALVLDLLGWLCVRYGDGLRERYPVGSAEKAVWVRAIRSPDERWAGPLRVDLAEFMRDRFAGYVGTLKAYAEQLGVTGVPFLVNVHGTEGGSAASFPIGISQLARSYSGVPGMLSGSDHYVGEMTLTATTDLYVLNAYSDASHDEDQALTSVEFETGSGDYSGGYESDADPSTVDLKTRLFAAQGNRIINYYLFAGGHNPHLDAPVGDGNDRIAITGERHGVAAPVGPEGQLTASYRATVHAAAAIGMHEQWLSTMDPEYDDVVLGFVPDAYATEYRYPGSALMAEISDDLTAHRGAGPRRALARSMLLAGYRFGAVDLQRDPGSRGRPVLALSTGRYLGAAVQRRVLAHVLGGGSLLLLGRLPSHDLDGTPCDLLAAGLGLRPGPVRRDGVHFGVSVRGAGWGALPGETRVGWAEPVHGGVPVLVDAADGAPVGVEVTAGAGRAVVLAADLPASPGLFGAALERLGARAGLSLDTDTPGLIGLTTADRTGQRLLHLLNVTPHPAGARPVLEDAALFDGRALTLAPRSGLLLPLRLRLPGGILLWSTAELSGSGPGWLSVGLRQVEECVVLDTGHPVTAAITGAAEGAGLRPPTVRRDGRRVAVTARTPPSAPGAHCPHATAQLTITLGETA
jgi:beta-galactosidase